MSTLTTTTSVSIALGRFCVGDLEETIVHTPAAMSAPYTPKASSRDFDDDDFDFEYFSRTYKPLSNLPTPPPSNRNSVASSPVLGDDDDLNADTALLGMLDTFHTLSFTCVCALTNQPVSQAQQSTSQTYTHQAQPSTRQPQPSSRQSSPAQPSLSKPSR